MSSSSAPAAKVYDAANHGRGYIDDDEDEQMMAAAVKSKADWKSNPMVPLGAFGGAVALACAFVAARKNSGWNMSQTIMQARVFAQGAAVSGLVGLGIYTSLEQRKKEEREAARVAARKANKA